MVLAHGAYPPADLAHAAIQELVPRPTTFNEEMRMEIIKKILRRRKLGVVGTTVLMALPLAFLAWWCYELRDATIFYDVFSGRFFAEQWDLTDPDAPFVKPELGRGYAVFAIIAVMTFPYLALVRTICARRTRFEYWTFVIPTALACLFLAGINTAFFCISIKWMLVAGRFSEGVVMGVVGYIIVLWFFLWAIWPPKRNHCCPIIN